MSAYRWILTAGSASTLIAAAACGSSSGSSPIDAGTDADQTQTKQDAGQQGGEDAAPSGVSLGFTPTNLTPGQLPSSSADGGAPGAVTISDPNCTIDTDQGTISCSSAPFGYTQVAGTAGSLAVFVVGSLTVQGAGQLRVQGSLPLAIVALDTVTIDGALNAGATSTTAVAGGASATHDGQAGGGPGGGAAASSPYSAAGGSYCGVGGAGGAGTSTPDGGSPPVG
jgi:hypothetical protein